MQPSRPACPTAQSRKALFSPLPTFVKPTIKPVPEQVEHNLSLSSRSIVDRHTDAEIGANVLPLADRYLHLRQHIPIGLCMVHQIPGRSKLEHRRPQPAQTVIRPKTLADRSIKKYRLRRDVRVPRQVRAKLRLNKCVGRKELIKSSKRFERRGSAPEASRPIAGWQNSAAKQAQNRSRWPQNRVRLQTRKHYPLEAQRGVADTAIPGVIDILIVDRNIDLDLIFYSEPLLMNDVSRTARRARSIQPRGNHHFVFGIRLFRNQRSRQVQFATRPVRIPAQSTQVRNHVIDLLRRQRIAERRHNVRESA